MATTAEETLRSYVAAFNKSDVDGISQLYASTTSYTNPFSPQPITSPSAVKVFETPMFSAFSDVSAEVEDAISSTSGDQVAARVTIRARHTGELQTPGGPVPATDKTIELRGAEWLRVDGEGRIVEHHRIFDGMSFMAQLGLV